MEEASVSEGICAHMIKQDAIHPTYCQLELYGSIVVVSKGQLGKGRIITMHRETSSETAVAHLSDLRQSLVKENYVSPEPLSKKAEEQFFADLLNVSKYPEFHDGLEVAESLLLRVSNENKKKLLKILFDKADWVMMGLGTKDGPDYDGEDSYYPEMLEDETRLKPKDAREVYGAKLAHYQKLIKML
ncbi:hypothetical protein [Leptospira borgpetersenii]|uniref:hypothetical protein n=1 Tax=Leptospira borgpetersenii TaxID=174 RepID=UPI001D13B918|nr:hypothetical protein [Leptospira borgpetersenii]